MVVVLRTKARSERGGKNNSSPVCSRAARAPPPNFPLTHPRRKLKQLPDVCRAYARMGHRE